MNGFKGFRVGKVSIYTRVFFFYFKYYIYGSGMLIPGPDSNPLQVF